MLSSSLLQPFWCTGSDILQHFLYYLKSGMFTSSKSGVMVNFFLYCYWITPEFSSLNHSCIHSHTISEDWEPRSDLAVWFWFHLSWDYSQVWAASSETWLRLRDLFRDPYMVASGSPLFIGAWPGTSVSHYMPDILIRYELIERQRERDGEKEGIETKPTLFHSVILDGTSYHFCHIWAHTSQLW